ncbi:GNAT family N-acetyltransferase [Lachnospiraceae bacterium 46-15]
MFWARDTMLKELSREEMRTLYYERMQGDFPPAELKPWKRIAEMLGEGIYFAYGFCEEGRIIAYAFFVVQGASVLLDYYAVSQEARGTGIGSRFLRLLKEELRRKDICTLIAEVENPDFAKSEAEREERKRRIRFYEKNGLILTEFCSCLFGVEYRIMYFPVQDGAGGIWAALDRIYHAMFDEKYFGREVMLPMA